MSDHDLVKRIEAVYRSSFTRFYRVAYGVVRDEGLAFDAVQDGFAGALRGRAGFRGEAPLEAWLWRSVVNAAIRIRSRSTVHVQEESGRGTDRVASESAATGEAIDLTVLTERQRLVVFLRYYADLDERTIGAILGIERGTVSATVHSALSVLRRELEVLR